MTVVTKSRRRRRGSQLGHDGCSKNIMPVVAKNDASCSKILLRLQQNIVVVVARSELRLMDVAKSFVGSSKIQLWLQLPLVVQCH